ncbi:MAG: hypothetical protein M3N41_08630 [Acidobacteriota bacterium]|nr:hypothetical protein [Acidobacteriota bacterium]
MALCTYCQNVTERYEGGTPVCTECSGASAAKPPQPLSHHAIYAALQQDVVAAEERANAANAAFREVMKDIPSNLPHPDGTQRVLNVCRLLSVARREMTEADSRLNEFLASGIVPAHLKR